MRRFLLICAAFSAGMAGAVGSGVSTAAVSPKPDSLKIPVTDEYHSVQVTDDYRWLENAEDPKVQAWGAAQNAYEKAYMDGVSFHEQVHARLDTLIRASSASWYDVGRHGKAWFAMKYEPKLHQPYLVTMASIDQLSGEKPLVDPNVIDPTGKTAIDFYRVSADGKQVAVSLSQNGSESGDVHLYTVADGKPFDTVIPRVNNGTAGGSVVFAPDGSGIWYTRYPRGEERPAEDAGFYQQVYFHKFGEKTEDDHYELGKELPRIAEIVLALKDDGKWLLAEVKNGDGGEVAFYLRSTQADAKWQQISSFADKIIQADFGQDQNLYLLSRMNAPRGKLLKLPLASLKLDQASEVVKESEGTIESFVVGNKTLYVADLLGGPSQIRRFDLASGKPLSNVPVLPVSSVSGLRLLSGDDVIFANVSYLKPVAWYRFDGKIHSTALVSTSIADYSDCEVSREFATSQDGTQVPLNIIRKKGVKLDGHNPTLLYAYGGYGVPMAPGFSASRKLWLEQGGVYVVANIRGGGEYGEDWHLQGNLTHKQNVFDDFYAAAQWLVQHHYTQPAKLAIMGASNGGLLMGVALTQHPEMYRAVASRVGIYDMLRVETTPNGAFNVTEFGTVKDPDQFKALYAYSPLHHVNDTVTYPAVILTTGANDPRVDSWQSKKFTARLQATQSSRPVVLRMNNAGHGMGTAIDEVIAETTDLYTFLMNELGMSPQFK